MNTALLHNGNVVAAKEYNAETHGNRLYCVDQSCKNVPVIYMPGTENVTPYFKTTGKGDSKHSEQCGFYRTLDFVESVKKVEEYQGDLLEKGMKETILRINLNRLDPEYESKTVEKDASKEQKKDPSEIKVKQTNETPASISSLKSIVKLMTSYEPDVLSSILVNIKGQKVPISSLIVDQEKAHELIWSEAILPNTSYFIYGEVENVIRLEKVIFIAFKPINNVPFSLVIFDRFFRHFTYSDSELKGKKVLAWGYLRKNTYQDKNTTEMAIKSNKYIEFL